MSTLNFAMSETRFKNIAKNLKTELEKVEGINSIGHAKVMQALSQSIYGMPYEALKVKLNQAEIHRFSVTWHPIDRDQEHFVLESTSLDEDVILQEIEDKITQFLFGEGEITLDEPETEFYIDHVIRDGDLFSEGANVMTTRDSLILAVGEERLSTVA